MKRNASGQKCKSQPDLDGRLMSDPGCDSACLAVPADRSDIVQSLIAEVYVEGVDVLLPSTTAKGGAHVEAGDALTFTPISAPHLWPLVAVHPGDTGIVKTHLAQGGCVDMTGCMGMLGHW